MPKVQTWYVFVRSIILVSFIEVVIIRDARLKLLRHLKLPVSRVVQHVGTLQAVRTHTSSFSTAFTHKKTLPQRHPTAAVSPSPVTKWRKTLNVSPGRLRKSTLNLTVS